MFSKPLLYTTVNIVMHILYHRVYPLVHSTTTFTILYYDKCFVCDINQYSKQHLVIYILNNERPMTRWLRNSMTQMLQGRKGAHRIYIQCTLYYIHIFVNLLYAIDFKTMVLHYICIGLKLKFSELVHIYDVEIFYPISDLFRTINK